MTNIRYVCHIDDMTIFSVQTIKPLNIEDYYLIRSDQCGVKERNSQMLISDDELKGKVGECAKLF